MKTKISRRAVSLLLALVLFTASFAGYRVHTVYGQEEAYIQDVIELQLNDGDRQYMMPYVNACYEAGFTTVEGVNRYRIYKNGKVIEERIVDTYPGISVFVRYFPYREKKVLDSVNEKSMFKTDGAWVGELTKLNSQRPDNARFKNWYPEDESGLMDYMGGGIYQKTYEFTEPLPRDIDLDYKIAFGKGWETPTIGGRSGSNFHITIPAGTTEISVWADSIKMECITSVEAGDFKGAGSGDELKGKADGTVLVSLSGSFNGQKDEDGSWRLKPMGKGIYGAGFFMEKGSLDYNVVFDGTIARAKEAGHSSLAQDGYVYFLYDSSRDLLFDSIKDSAEIEKLLNFERPLTAEELDRKAYSGNDLGAVYTKESTQFKVWAPTASAVRVKLYSTGNAGDDSLIKSEPMTFSEKDGVWSAVVPGDLNGVFYTYSVTIGFKTQETADIYAKAVGLNGERGMVVDLASTDPSGWESDSFVSRAESTDAIIWETHVRDFSISSDSGVSAANRGKYLAFTETGTTVNGEGKISTGLDYLKKLGVNYIHLLPAQDYVNDETNPSYNWGYSTKNYHVPEGSYSSDPADGYKRITEFKQMVQALHKADIGVVMDVVYNHTGETEYSWFNRTVPGYYYRLDENGDFLDRTLCGNETASEHLMFRKFMVDSLLYWAKEYHVDGFRFDLMAIHDTETMNAIRQALDDAGLSNVILYGEPWYATDNGSELAPGYLASNKDNAGALNDRIALFNSYTRTGFIGGLDGVSAGFVQGGQSLSPEVAKAAEGEDASVLSAIKASSDGSLGTAASPAWSRNPSQSISYTSCHDDCTLWDWLYNSVYGAPSNTNQYGMRDEALIKMNKMAALLNMTNQGSVLFQSGEEFARTKGGDSDSYQSPDSVNEIRWARLEQFSDLSDYYKGLIEIRKAIAAFHDQTNGSLQTIQTSDENESGLIAYTIQNGQYGSAWTMAAVIVNSSHEEHTVDLKAKDGALPGAWAVLADGEHAGTETLRVIDGNTITVPAQTGMILVNADGAAPAASQEETAQSGQTSEESKETEDGKKTTAAGIRYYDEDGKLLTGWVRYDKSTKEAVHFEGGLGDGDKMIYYCNSDGYPVTGWQQLWEPVYEKEDGLDHDAIRNDEAEMQWYYFQDNGRAYRNKIVDIDGEKYCFDEEGRLMKGWIYELKNGGETTYVTVDSDTSASELEEYNKDYSQYLYADPYSGQLARSQWKYLLYPGREDELNLDDDGRNFYFKSGGHLEVGEETLVKTAITVDEIGTYKLRDYSQQFTIIRMDGEYYIIDDVKGSIGDVVYLTGGSQVLPDGFYCFKGDNSKMLTGDVTLRGEEGDENFYYYRFAPKGTSEYKKGQGVTGVYGGKLYYQGLSVGAQEGEDYELVYLPTLADKENGATGMFLVDEKGNVKTGRRENSDGTEYKVVKKKGCDEKYGYEIYRIDEVGGKKKETLLTSEAASLIYLDDIER